MINDQESFQDSACQEEAFVNDNSNNAHTLSTDEECKSYSIVDSNTSYERSEIDNCASPEHLHESNKNKKLVKKKSSSNKPVKNVKLNSNSTVIKRKRNQKQKKPMGKRTVNREEWTDVKAKKARALGIAGVGRKNVEIPEKKMLPGCDENCKNKCYQKITEEERSKAFKAYYQLGDINKQRECITNWVKQEDVKVHKRLNTEEESSASIKQKTYSYFYELPTSNGLVKVCRTMFTKTLVISKDVIYTAFKKKKESGDTMVISSDNRGKHNNRPFKTTEEQKNTVRAHIESFPLIESRNGKQYLQEGLSISKLYRLYEAEMKTQNKCKWVSFQIYRLIFLKEYNYKFFVPKKET